MSIRPERGIRPTKTGCSTVDVFFEACRDRNSLARLTRSEALHAWAQVQSVFDHATGLLNRKYLGLKFEPASHDPYPGLCERRYDCSTVNLGTYILPRSRKAPGGAVTLNGEAVIPKALTDAHSRAAAKYIDQHGTPRARRTRHWRVIIGRKPYPPKHFINIAAQLARIPLTSSRLFVAEEAKRFLMQRKYALIDTRGLQKGRAPVGCRRDEVAQSSLSAIQVLWTHLLRLKHGIIRATIRPRDHKGASQYGPKRKGQ
jgi:hypothetical protein